MWYAICMFIGLVMGIFIIGILASGKREELEMKIYRLKNENRTLEHLKAGEVWEGDE